MNPIRYVDISLFLYNKSLFSFSYLELVVLLVFFFFFFKDSFNLVFNVYSFIVFWILKHSAYAKIYVYFNIITYFFYFIYSFFKSPHIRLSILYYNFLKILIFLDFLIVSLLSHTTTIIHSLLLSSGYVKKKKKSKCKINSISVNLYDY